MNKEKHRENRRLKVRVWAYGNVVQIIKSWGEGWRGNGLQDEEKLEEYVSIWQWLVSKAETEGKDLYQLPATSGGLRLTVEYMRRVLEDEMETHTNKEFKEKCQVKMDDYLIWMQSDLAQFVFRCERIIESERINSQMHVARKKLLKGLEAGDKKSLDTWLKFVGRDKGIATDNTGYVIRVVDRYAEDGETEPAPPMKKSS